MEKSVSISSSDKKFCLHGWIGASLILVFWLVNWNMEGLRTHWGFFPMWLGYCLLIDALVFYRTGTSLVTRSLTRYLGLFVVSAPSWWLFEVINVRTQNWLYLGAEYFTPWAYAFWATLNFSTVIPAVFGTAELVRSFSFIKGIKRGPVIKPDPLTTVLFFTSGLVLFGLMMVWPVYFFPFVWLSVYFILEPLNIWLRNRSLARYTRIGDWRPIIALWIGALICGFFWEMWNVFSFPKWIYQVPGVGVLHIFEMPLLGYGGYMPFALELYALYHLIAGLLGRKNTGYIKLEPV
jgi:hypothetical protein